VGLKARASQHPPPATLKAFALGRLHGPDMERVTAHLANCPVCSRAADAVPADRLIMLLRRGVEAVGPGVASSPK
jgi:anti-sigma factor ChrR (cupin superfamily)